MIGQCQTQIQGLLDNCQRSTFFFFSLYFFFFLTAQGLWPNSMWLGLKKSDFSLQTLHLEFKWVWWVTKTLQINWKQTKKSSSSDVEGKRNGRQNGWGKKKHVLLKSSVSPACILECVCACLAQSVWHDCSGPPRGSALPSRLFTLHSPPVSLHEAGRVGEADSDGEPSAVMSSNRGTVLDNWTHAHRTATRAAQIPVRVLQRLHWECTGWISMFSCWNYYYVGLWG